MSNEQLTEAIEKLALEVVLLDHTNTEEMEGLVSLFSQIADWATDNSQPLLLETAVNCMEVLRGIINKTGSASEKSFEVVCKVVSEIQTHARNEFDFSQMLIPKEISHCSQEGAAPDHSSIHLRHPATLPSYLDNGLFSEFLSIQSANLDKMESLILSIEEKAEETDIVELKRMIHTVKGEAGFLNLNEVETVCHLTEDILVEDAPDKHADLFLRTIDWMRQTFSWYSGSSVKPTPSADLIEVIKNCNSSATHNDPLNFDTINTDKYEIAVTEQLNKNRTDISEPSDLFYRFISRIDNSIDSSAKILSKLLYLIKDKPEQGNQPNVAIQKIILKLQYYITKITAVSDFISLNEIQLLTKHTHNLLDIMITDIRFCNADLIDLVKKSFDYLKRQTRSFETALTEKKPVDYHKDFPKHIAMLQTVVAEISGKTNCEERSSDSEKQHQTLPLSAQHVPPDTKENESLQKDSTKTASSLKEQISVDAERLDRIIDMIGELVIAESMVIQADEIKKIDSQELTRHLNQMNKITRGLQETGLSLRMLPIKSTFQKMSRIARDTAKKSGKEVKFIMQGEETELDKTLVDKIGDPLLHMVRNAIDHGIEKTVEERIAHDKPPAGTVKIRAYHKGGNIHIEIEDDGKGLDKEKILKKAIEQQIVQEDEVLSDKEIFNLIFEPGFTTANEITDLSGRGVGMNVVKSSIEALQGQVDIRSEQNTGSTFTIKIPLTLAIIDGMVVRVQNERYIIPTLSIVTSSKLSADDVTSIFNTGKMIDVQEKLVPLFFLGTLLEGDTFESTQTQSLMVVVEEDGKQAAIVVDELLGKQQIVIKTLGESMQNIPGISGGAIMPDGRVGLIIDVGGLVSLAHSGSTREV